MLLSCHHSPHLVVYFGHNGVVVVGVLDEASQGHSCISHCEFLDDEVRLRRKT